MLDPKFSRENPNFFRFTPPFSPFSTWNPGQTRSTRGAKPTSGGAEDRCGGRVGGNKPALWRVAQAWNGDGVICYIAMERSTHFL